MNNEFANKPPLGTEPAYLCAAGRIRDLSGAINRTAIECTPGEEYRIRNWAREIIMQCDIMSALPINKTNNVAMEIFHAMNNIPTNSERT